MGVIALPNIDPQGGGGSETDWELRSLTARFPGTLGASVKTLERPGAAWAATVPYRNLSGSNLYCMQSFLAACRGQAQRFYLSPKFSTTTIRGSFPATELFTNNLFASGTTGWSSTSATLTADAFLRVAALTPTTQTELFQTVAMTQYAPHAVRSLLVDGAQTSGLSIGRFINGTSDYSTSRGLGTLTAVPLSGSAQAVYAAVINSSSGFTAGAYLTVGYASCARCMLVDNGPNLLLRSDEFDNASWTKTRCSTTANNAGAPDGTITGDTLTEDATASSTHVAIQSATVSASALDYSFTVALKAGARTWAQLTILEGTGGSEVFSYFNLSTGVLGTAGAGSNWSNARAFVTALGNGWYRCTIVGRKTNAATTISGRVYLATADNTNSYNGDGTSYINVWRATLAQSAVPSRLKQTTTTASSGTSQTGGAAYIKGLPSSTNGLLLPGDWIEFTTSVGTELKRVTAPLNSDASQLGYLEFEPPLRNSPADGAAVIVCRPMMRALLDSNTVQWSEHSGGFCDLEFKAVEDVAA